MRVLIVGSGGREHALAWKIAQSPSVAKIWVAPGNAGTAEEFKTENIAINTTDIEKLVTFAKEHQIDLTIVGPETSLALGIVDAFHREALVCLGPTQKAAELESSKEFSKDLMRRYQIPTAPYEKFKKADSAIQYLSQQTFPIVIKVDGLAQGKGVFIAANFAQARQIVIDILEGKKFGEAGATIIIEKFLKGTELSFIVITDGKHVIPLASAQDYKRRNNGNLGPNTGGMGALSPSPLLTDALQNKILEKIIFPTLRALSVENKTYTGFLYAGLMISEEGDPYVLEFNCRLGDPETQPILMRLQTDLANLLLAATQGKLEKYTLNWDTRAALCVVLATQDYPEKSNTGTPINGLKNAFPTNCKIFHAGTAYQNSHIVTNGGRILAITTLQDSLLEARARAYDIISRISWPGCYYREDIGIL